MIAHADKTSNNKATPYAEFIAAKQFARHDYGFDSDLSTYPLFDYQAPIVKWACKRGRAAVFADTGLGKTLMQLVWADQVSRHTRKPVLVVAPLAVSLQTALEAEKFGIPANNIRITNYEQIHKHDPSDYAGVVLDESSILKGDGKMRARLNEFAAPLDYRLSCTATPSPNDFMELGTQSEFLGIMSQDEMLAQFFVHDGSETQKWRLKGHGKSRFFEWMATWAVMIRSPADLGFDDSDHVLPPIKYHSHVVDSSREFVLGEQIELTGLVARNNARRESIESRCNSAAQIASTMKGPRLVWCNLNDESALLKSLIPGAVEVKGSDSPEHKEKSLIGFANGEIECLVSKPKIAGFGLNLQVCHQQIFTGLSDSWEQYYQAVRRSWRFGQKNPVDVHIVSAADERDVVENIKRKQAQQNELGAEMTAQMRKFYDREIFQSEREIDVYNPTTPLEVPAWL